MGKDWFKIYLLAVVLVLAGFIFYYYNITVPKIEVQKVMEEDKSIQAKLLQGCLGKADANFDIVYGDECSAATGSFDCNLLPAVQDSLNQEKQMEKEDCFEQYPQN